MPNFSGGTHGGLAPTTRQALLDRHGRWNTVNRIHLGATSGLHNASRIGVQTFQVTALPFVEQNIKRQGGLTGTADTGHHIELPTRYVNAQALQVVLFGMDDANCVADFGSRHSSVLGNRFIHRMDLPHALLVVAQGLPSVRGGMFTQSFGRTFSHQQTTAFAAFRPQIDQPIAGANHIQIVFNDDQGVSCFQQATQCPHQLGDVFKVQAGGGFIK